MFRSLLNSPYDVQAPLLHIADKGLVKGPEVHQSRNQCEGNEDKGNKGHGEGLKKWPGRPPKFSEANKFSFAGHYLIVTGHLPFVNIYAAIRRLCRHFPPSLDIFCLSFESFKCLAASYIPLISCYFNVLTLDTQLWHDSCYIKSER